ncbi:unnamed protein product [Rhizophagus irregularis]|nr:unnamed protein product [Rhizophagus irregularis]
MNKINPSSKKQAAFMKKFFSGDDNEKNDKQIVFTNEGFHERIAIWVAIDDQPFTFVEYPEFRQLMEYCGIKASIPSADTV